MISKIAIGLGSNLGDRLSNLRNAAILIAQDCLTDMVSSSVYESKPWGLKEQGDFLNAVVVGYSIWKPHSILNFLKSTEKEMGRAPSTLYGPRLIDLDLLAYGNEIHNSEKIIVPHPHLSERDFVLLPFAESWTEWVHPILHEDVSSLIQSLRQKQLLTATVVAPPLLSKVSP